MLRRIPALFASTEMFEYPTFVMYTTLTALITLPRADLKKRVIDSPEVLAVIGDMPAVKGLVRSGPLRPSPEGPEELARIASH